MSVWTWDYEQKQLYLEYSNDKDKFLKNIPMPHKNDVELFFPHVHGWKSKMDEMFGWKWNINELFGW